MEWNEFEKPSTDAWVEKIRRSVKDPKELEQLIWSTPEGFRLNSFYRAEDLEKLPAAGVRFEKRGWEITQVIHTDKITAANQSALKALENGADSILFKGSAAPSESEMQALFKDINLDWFASHYDFGESNVAMLYLLLDHFESRGYDLSAMTGSICLDPLSELYLQGNFEYTEQETFHVLKAVMDTARDQLPRFRVIDVHTAHLRDAGANAVQELATALSQMAEYAHRLTELGFQPKDIFSRMQIHSGIGGDYFIEIAKFRALNMLAGMLTEAYGCPDEIIPVRGVTSIRNKTVFDPHTNMLRAVSEAMSAAIGGADAILVSPFDEVYRLPDEFSYRMTRNLQLILKEEAGIAKVADPSAGSYYIETITQKLMDEAWAMFLEMEKLGGYIAALKGKFIQQRIEFVAGKEKENFSSGKKVLIGTNKYPDKAERKTGQYTRLYHSPILKGDIAIVPLRPERLSESLEMERMKMESQKAEKEN